ncbi:hypothetical protein [Mesorhizobium sp. M0091]|uniref:hypothetical protein n=1 Tax=Mesorhizobium sp. M0091 TaxID=2956875 RepID=UPI00333B9CE9
MNIAMRFAAVVVGMSSVAGCTSMSESDFNTIPVTLSSPTAKRSYINECVADERATSQSDKNNLSALMNVSPARYETAFCSRLVNALANGKITYADYRKMLSPSADNSKLIKILQGRY